MRGLWSVHGYDSISGQSRWQRRRNLTDRILSPTEAVLIAHPLCLAVFKVNLQHILAGANYTDRSMRPGIEDFSPVVAVLIRCNVGVIALDRKGQPVGPMAAAQGNGFLEEWGHRIARVPDIDMRISPITALPDLALVGRPADPVHQTGTVVWMLCKFSGRNAAGVQIGNLHAPQAGHVVDDVTARAIDRIGAENAGVKARFVSLRSCSDQSGTGNCHRRRRPSFPGRAARTADTECRETASKNTPCG